jgi:hypothetical protein
LHTEKIVSYLPPFITNSNIIQDICKTYETEFDIFSNKVEDLLAQLSLQTATWGLDLYEKELNIKPNYTRPLEERRNVIKSKWRGLGKVNRTLIKIVADDFTNGQVEVNFTDKKITIKFMAVHGIPPSIEDLYKAIEDIKPAHLDVKYILTYNTYGYLKQYQVGFLSAFTLDELRTLTQFPTQTQGLKHSSLNNVTNTQLEVTAHAK